MFSCHNSKNEFILLLGLNGLTVSRNRLIILKINRTGMPVVIQLAHYSRTEPKGKYLNFSFALEVVFLPVASSYGSSKLIIKNNFTSQAYKRMAGYVAHA